MPNAESVCFSARMYVVRKRQSKYGMDSLAKSKHVCNRNEVMRLLGARLRNGVKTGQLSARFLASDFVLN